MMPMPSDAELRRIAYDMKNQARAVNRALMDALVEPESSRYVDPELAAIAAVKRAVIEALAREAKETARNNRVADGLSPDGSMREGVFIPAKGGESLSWYQIIDWLRSFLPVDEPSTRDTAGDQE